MTPQLLISLDSPRAIEMLLWLLDNCSLSGFKAQATYRQVENGSLRRGLWSKLSMADGHAVMFKLTFPEAIALESLTDEKLTTTIYFFDNARYQRTSSPNIDFWQIIPPETFQ